MNQQQNFRPKAPGPCRAFLRRTMPETAKYQGEWLIECVRERNHVGEHETASGIKWKAVKS